MVPQRDGVRAGGVGAFPVVRLWDAGFRIRDAGRTLQPERRQVKRARRRHDVGRAQQRFDEVGGEIGPARLVFSRHPLPAGALEVPEIRYGAACDSSRSPVLQDPARRPEGGAGPSRGRIAEAVPGCQKALGSTRWLERSRASAHLAEQQPRRERGHRRDRRRFRTRPSVFVNSSLVTGCGPPC